jgi:hypothetical protein
LSECKLRELSFKLIGRGRQFGLGLVKKGGKRKEEKKER